MGGRPPKPTAIHELSGAYKKNPGRRRENEPEPERGIGPAPSHFDDDHAAIWDELVYMAAPGVLTISDRTWLELTADLLHIHRNGIDVNVALKDSVVTVHKEISASDRTILVQLLSRLGFNPTDRTKIIVPKKAAENPFKKFKTS